MSKTFTGMALATLLSLSGCYRYAPPECSPTVTVEGHTAQLFHVEVTNHLSDPECTCIYIEGLATHDDLYVSVPCKNR